MILKDSSYAVDITQCIQLHAVTVPSVEASWRHATFKLEQFSYCFQNCSFTEKLYNAVVMGWEALGSSVASIMHS